VDALPDRVLYLDVDVMLHRDIHLLYDIDIEGYEYAAARDHYGKYLIQPNYINAGVLLFNLKEMRKTGILAKAREWIRAKKLVFADQSALIRATTRKKMLPQRFNDQKFLHKHTVVRHFSKRLFWLPYPHTANIKQWHVEKVHKIFKYTQFDDILDEYTALIQEFRSKY
jgi:lipopolysaccharide biosynthesis glycosyltransferase